METLELTDTQMNREHLDRLNRLSPLTRTFIENLEARFGHDAAFTACLAVCNELDTVEHQRKMKTIKRKGAKR